MKLAFCFPGQGSQEVGMGRAFAEAAPEAAAVYEQAALSAAFPVAEVCFDGPIEELTRTEIQQPALVTTEIACLAAIRASGIRPDVVIGHSVGEYAALVAAGILDVDDAVRLVSARGVATAAAARDRAGVMAAIIGLDDETVEQLCGADDEVWPANYNCPGQVVISGAVEAVERVLAAATEAGARRAVTLKVTGAFHSPLVGAAAERLRPAVEGSRFSPAAIPFMSTVSCRMETHERVPALLLEQLSAPVRFTQAIGALVSAGVETFVEVGPGQVLAGLIKRIDRSVRVLSVADPTGLARLSAELEGAVA